MSGGGVATEHEDPSSTGALPTAPALEPVHPSQRDRSSRRRGAWAPRTAWALPLVALVVIGTPLYLGGAPAPSVPLATTVALLALAVVGIEWRSVRRDRLVHAALVVIGVSVFQLVPLPPILLRALDPASADVSARALEPFRVARDHAWRALHLDPGNGWSLTQYIIGLLAMYVVAKRLAVREHVAGLLRIAAAATLTISVVALIHGLVDLEKVYGLYTPRFGLPPILSPLLNANHLSAFAGAGAILWTGLAAGGTGTAERLINGVGALLCGAVCVLSVSRSGVLVTGASMALLLACLQWMPTRSRRRSTRRFFAVTTMACFSASAALYLGWYALRREFVGGDLSKFEVIRGVAGTLRHHPMLGAGLGGCYAAVSTDGVFSGSSSVEWAESLPVDLAVGIGPVAAVVALALAAAWAWRARPAPRTVPPEALAALIALGSLVVHDLADFSLWLGACGYLAAVLAGVVAGDERLRTATPTLRQTHTSGRVLVLGLAVVSAMVGTVTARSTLAVDRDHAERAASFGRMSLDELRRAIVRHPADAYLTLAGASVMLRQRNPLAFRLLNQAMILSPAWAAPHLMLARVLLARGQRSQSLVEIRQALVLDTQPSGGAVVQLVEMDATPDEIERCIPEGPRGVAFLQHLGGALTSSSTGPAVDEMLLARSASDADALVRQARRAGALGHHDEQRTLLERLIAAHPTLAAGYRDLSTVDLDGGDLARAEADARRGIDQTHDLGALLPVLGRVQSRRRDVVAMRATYQQWLEVVGADIDRRIAVLGELGNQEESLGNQATALTAFERADSMAFPEHPYLVRIVALARALHDDMRLRGACNTLHDLGPIPDAAREACGAAMRAPNPMAPMTIPTEPPG